MTFCSQRRETERTESLQREERDVSFAKFPKTRPCRAGQRRAGTLHFRWSFGSRVHGRPDPNRCCDHAGRDLPWSRQPSNCCIIITNGWLCAARGNSRGHGVAYVFAFSPRCLPDLVAAGARDIVKSARRIGAAERHMNRAPSMVSSRVERKETERNEKRDTATDKSKRSLYFLVPAAAGSAA